MAEPKTEQEPSIEEILESIRQIISDDTEAAPAAAVDSAPKKAAPPPQQTMTYDAPKPAPAATPAAPAPVAAAPAPAGPVAPAAASTDDDEVIDLVDVVPSAQTQEIEVDLREIDNTPAPITAEADHTVAMGGVSRMADTTETNSDPDILSENTADAATAAMARLLASNVAVERDEPARVGRVTLEDLAREMMRPLIKSWLDQNLPRVIEKIVAREVEKLSRRALDQ